MALGGFKVQVTEVLLRKAADEISAKHLAKCQRLRAEEAAENLSDPVCADDFGPDAAFANDHSKGDLDQPEKETLPTHDQQFHQGAQCCNQRNCNQSRKIDVPNLKASVGEAGVVSSGDWWYRWFS